MFLSKKFFQRRKMKCCKSSETRFAKVSRRSEPCSGGKRPFEVSKKNRNSRVGVRKGNVAQELHAFGAVLVLRYRLKFLIGTCSDLFGTIWMGSDVFGCVRTHSDVFGSVRNFLSNFFTYGNFSGRVLVRIWRSYVKTGVKI